MKHNQDSFLYNLQDFLWQVDKGVCAERPDTTGCPGTQEM